MGSVTMERIAAVVVTYNRKDLLQQCLRSILAQQQIACDARWSMP